MGKTKLILSASLLLLVSGQVNAALIEQTFDFSISNGLIYDTVDNAGNSGKGIELQITTAPFFLASGDVVSTHINFDKPLRIRDVGQNEFWSSSNGSIVGSEPLSFIYWFTDNISGTGSNADASVSYEVTFDVFAGVLAQSSITDSLNTAGGGTSMATTIRSNITDSVVSIVGIDILTNINSYILNRNDGEYSLFSAQIRAGDLRVLPVSEPQIIWLFGSALIGLIGFSKRRQHHG